MNFKIGDRVIRTKCIGCSAGCQKTGVIKRIDFDMIDYGVAVDSDIKLSLLSNKYKDSINADW